MTVEAETAGAAWQGMRVAAAREVAAREVVTAVAATVAAAREVAMGEAHLLRVHKVGGLRWRIRRLKAGVACANIRPPGKMPAAGHGPIFPRPPLLL